MTIDAGWLYVILIYGAGAVIAFLWALWDEE